MFKSFKMQCSQSAFICIEITNIHQNLYLMLVYDPTSPAGVLNTAGFYFVVKT